MSYIQNDYQFQELFSKRHYPKETKARILPFYVVNNNLYFLLCQENHKHEHVQGIYNILGGYRDKDETIIECAMRELKEETLNKTLFNQNLLRKDLILKRNKRYIIFLPIMSNIEQIIPQFEYHKEMLKNNKNCIFKDYTNIECLCEIKALKWVSYKEIRGRNMYRSVQDIFKSIILSDNTQISFENYMNYLKQLYKKELEQSPNSITLNGTLFCSNSLIRNNSMPHFYNASNFYIIRNPKPIIRQEYLTSTTQSYST